jgi:E3 ubiquitin-protein ligase RNF115/126
MAGERDALDILHEMFQNERSFYSIVRFLDGGTRNHIVAAHMRNVNATLGILRQYTSQTTTTNMVLNIPLGSMDMSGNFFDPVPVVPTPQQIEAALDRHVNAGDANCAICQEAVPCGTRIRGCGHTFHHQCITQWFTMNTRCPVCRYDVRSLQRNARNENNAQSRSMHSDS